VSDAAVRVEPALAAELTTRPWGLTPDNVAGIMRELRFRHFKWDTYASGGCLVVPESLLLSRQAHEGIVALVEGLDQVLIRFERRVRRDPAALRSLGIPPAMDAIIADEPEGTLQIGRYDLFLTPGGRWMISEFNEDVPGGFNEAALPELLGDPGPGARWEGDLRRRFVDAFRDYENVALLYATGFAEDLQHVLILERWLTDAGHPTVLASPAHLTRRWRRPRILGTPIDAAFRFYPGEWMPRLPNLATWRRVAPRLPMMNPFHRLIRQSKSVFALMRHGHLLDPADRALVDRHCPYTVPFDPGAMTRLREEKERWVLKRAFGRMGDAVVIGALVPDKEWTAALATAARSPGDFCVQERFEVRPVAFEAGPLYPSLGAFVVNGRFAGYYSRAAAEPFITHRASHVATLVESA
jgi:glutathionylspermidine synthase